MMKMSLNAAIMQCKDYITRGTRIPNNGRLGFPVTLYRDEGVCRIPVRVYFYNEPEARDDVTEFNIAPGDFNDAIFENSEEMFWDKFTEDMEKLWGEFSKENNLSGDCITEVAILY